MSKTKLMSTFDAISNRGTSTQTHRDLQRELFFDVLNRKLINFINGN